MNTKPEIYIGNQTIEIFQSFIDEKGFERFLVVCDQNTYAALGKRVQSVLDKKGFDSIFCIFNPESLISDCVALSKVFAAYDGSPRLFISIGSGTITDITRFVSFKSQNPFVSFPTAASVDAYASHNAPVTIGNLKRSINCHSPLFLFTDLDTIVNAPNNLTVSGFADLMSKFTSAADWQITKLVWGASFSRSIHQRVINAALSAKESYNGLLRHDPESFADLIAGQFESGLCMVDFGNSMPASGGEHHIAHIWEMMSHWENLLSFYHGNAVGVATVFEAAIFERVSQLTKSDVQHLLEDVTVPNHFEQRKALESVLPKIAEIIIESNPIYWQLTDVVLLSLVKKRIIENWEEIRDIALDVPKAKDFQRWIKDLGGPITAKEMGLSEAQRNVALEFGHYIRERFSINLIRKLFGWKIEDFV